MAEPRPPPRPSRDRHHAHIYIYIHTYGQRSIEARSIGARSIGASEHVARSIEARSIGARSIGAWSTEHRSTEHWSIGASEHVCGARSIGELVDQGRLCASSSPTVELPRRARSRPSSTHSTVSQSPHSKKRLAAYIYTFNSEPEPSL